MVGDAGDVLDVVLVEGVVAGDGSVEPVRLKRLNRRTLMESTSPKAYTRQWTLAIHCFLTAAHEEDMWSAHRSAVVTFQE